MQLIKPLIISLTLTLLLSSCSGPKLNSVSDAANPPPIVVEKAVPVPVSIPKVSKPQKPNLVSPRLKVINGSNYNEFFQSQIVKNPNQAFVVITVKDYENLSVNIEKMKAFMSQQNDIINYYESAIAGY